MTTKVYRLSVAKHRSCLVFLFFGQVKNIKLYLGKREIRRAHVVLGHGRKVNITQVPPQLYPYLTNILRRGEIFF